MLHVCMHVTLANAACIHDKHACTNVCARVHAYHMTCLYHPPHMTCMYPPPHMTCTKVCTHARDHMTCMYPRSHMICTKVCTRARVPCDMNVSFSSCDMHEGLHACMRTICACVHACMYPPPHMTCMYHRSHMTCTKVCTHARAQCVRAFTNAYRRA